jgi:hypothetical protein
MQYKTIHLISYNNQDFQKNANFEPNFIFKYFLISK